MYNFLVHFHSGWRWIYLVLLVFALINSFLKWRQGAEFQPGDGKINLYAMSAAHLQLIVGLVLYFLSPKVQFSGAAMQDALLRFFTAEHITTMVVAILLITLGYSRAKRATVDTQKFRLAFWFFLGGLIFTLVGIPWPWQEYGTGWF